MVPSTACGIKTRHQRWHYTPAQRKRTIAALEGDAVLRACRTHRFAWEGCRVPLHIDNQTFMKALIKGRSYSKDLNSIISSIHNLAIKHNFVLEPVCIRSKDNEMADALSRHQMQRCNRLERAHSNSLLAASLH